MIQLNFQIDRRLVVLCTSLSLTWTGCSTASNCDSLSRPTSSSGYEISADPRRPIRLLSPEYFGFNIEWVEFQLSLWDSTSRRVMPDVVNWMSAFPGAVYRYPGGTVSNYFDWRDAIGNIEQRAPQTPVTWRAPLVNEFGLPEYLSFVHAVGGKAWYVLNIYGALNTEKPAADMGQEVAGLATYLRNHQLEGKPPIYRWELGNELDRDRYRWHPHKYSKTALDVTSKLRAVDPDAKIVSLAQDWPASKDMHGISAHDYNMHLGKAFKGNTNEFSAHHYYDGRPWGPPIPHQIRQHCRNSQSLMAGLGEKPTIWVTEHGRTPIGTPADNEWKRNWPQTADLGAAISVADLVIALAQDPMVKGLFVHALHGTDGPWPLFHKRKGFGGIVPSATYWALRLLRESLLDEVVATQVKSGNRSGYEGGYDVRAVVMANTQRDKFSVWLINRATQTIDARLTIPTIASKRVMADMTILSAEDATTHNYGGQTRLRPRKVSRPMQFDTQGSTVFNVPANAVVAIQLPIDPGQQ